MPTPNLLSPHAVRQAVPGTRRPFGDRTFWGQLRFPWQTGMCGMRAIGATGYQAFSCRASGGSGALLPQSCVPARTHAEREMTDERRRPRLITARHLEKHFACSLQSTGEKVPVPVVPLVSQQPAWVLGCDCLPAKLLIA